MSRTEKVTKSVLFMMVFTMGSKLLGFVREMLIASRFGAGVEIDTYLVATTATFLFTHTLGSAINTTMIPILSEAEKDEGKDKKIEHTNNILNIMIIISVFLIILSWLGAPLIINILGSGFVGEQYYLAIKLMRVGLPVILLTNLVNIFRGYLQSEMMFTEAAVTGLPLNILYILFLLFGATKYGIEGLMITSVLAVMSQVLIQIPELKKTGFKYKYIFDLKDKYVKKILILIGPILLSVAIGEVNIIVDRTLASNLVTGSISALNYANKLNGLILGVFISAITTVVFPLLSKESNSGNIKSMKRIMGYGVNLILLITIPATVGLVVLSTPIVQVAFERGAFTPNDTIMTSSALVFYSLGLVASSLRLLTTRVYYSLQDTKTPMINGSISVGFNIVLNLILVKFMAHSGLALATSIATTISTLLMFYGLKKKIGSLGTIDYITTFLKSGLASAIMGVVSYTVYHGLYGVLEVSKLYNLISLLVAVGLAVVVYVVLCYVFRVGEVRDVINKIKLKLKTK